MMILLIILGVPVAAITMYFLVKRMDWLVYGYLAAVPVLPAMPLGSIEISVLDFLTVPALVHLMYRLFGNGFRLQGYLAVGMSFYALAAVVSFAGFTVQQGFFSAAIMMRMARLIEITLPVILVSLHPGMIDRRKAVTAFLIGGGLSAMIGIAMFLSNVSWGGAQRFISLGELVYRAAGTHGDTGSFGNLMGLNALVALWVILYGRKVFKAAKSRSLYWMAAVSGFFSLAALVLSLSRGGMVLLAVGMVVLLFPLLRRPGRLLKLAVIGAALVLIVTGVLWTRIENELVVKAIDALTGRVTIFGEISSRFDAVTSYRTHNWAEAWVIFKGSPLAWPFGLGYKALILHYDMPPDNNFMQALFEMGLLGAAAILMLTIFGYQLSFRCFQHDRSASYIGLALWTGLVSNMFTADVLTYWHNIPALFILLVVICGRKEKN